MYKLIYQYLKDFPKKERYTLGEKIENSLLDLIEGAALASQLPKSLKEAHLLKLNAKVELLKILIRLAYEIKVIDDKKYLRIQESLQEIGRMLGGWIKYLRSN